MNVASMQSTRRTAWGITALLLAFMLINFADKALLGLAADQLMEELGLSAEQYGLISSAFYLLFSIFAIIGGMIGDRISSKVLLLGMALIWSVAQLPMLLPLGAYGFWVLLGSRSLLGAAEGPAYPLANQTAHRWFPDAERDLPGGILAIGGPLGVVLAAPALTWVIANFGWRTAFVVMAVLGLVWALVWARLGKDRPTAEVPAAHTTTDVEVERVDANRVSAPVVVADSRSAVPYRRILLTRTWIGTVITGLGTYWAQGLLVAWVPIYVTKVLGMQGATIGLVVALPWAVMVLTVLLQGLVIRSLHRRGVSTRYSRGALASVALVICGGCVLASTWADSTWVKVALLAVGFGIIAIAIPIAQAICSEISPPQRNGGVLGAYVAVCSLAAIAAPTVTGRIISSADSYFDGFNEVFVTSGILFVVAGLLGAALIDPPRDRARLALVLTRAVSAGMPIESRL